MADAELLARVTDVIVSLHDEFERWLGGVSNDFTPIAAAISDDFTFISPDGESVAAVDLLAGLEAEHGSRPIGIRIANVVVRWHVDPAVLATYEEWQSHEDHTTARLSTVLFTEDPDAPGGLRWRHVHETWKLPPPRPPVS